MTFDSLIQMARQQGASDLHLEPGLPTAIRVRGHLQTVGEPMPAHRLLSFAQEIVGTEDWPVFSERLSYDCSRTIHGVRCRINILHTSRGIGFAVRLLSSFQATIKSLNLHPDLRRFVIPHNGLVLVSGPTGSGKSSTLAALIQEINLGEARHIVTIENPIEYSLRPNRSFIRQREVGRDTPSFEQALLDVLREDPDVVMVGEMREPETMRLTLNAAETGHLVLATVHSATCVEALQRIVSAFPADIQSAVSAQLADSLVGVVAQRLTYRADLKIQLPELEILSPSNPVKAHIRNQEFFKIGSVLETGAEQGMWTYARYRQWMDKHGPWFVPDPNAQMEEEPAAPAAAPRQVVPKPVAKPPPAPSTAAPKSSPGHRIEIEPVEGGWDDLLRSMK